jgi:hypothetical protein
MTATIIQPEWFATEDYISPKYSADCVNTKSKQGRNATPLGIFPAVRHVLGGIELDPASDEVINQGVGADRIFTFEDDGFSKPWKAESLFLNAPGKTVTGGTYAQRLYWLEQMEKPAKERGERPEGVKVITAIDWYRKLYQEWVTGSVKRAIALHYRGGSIGGLGVEILSLPLCITAKGAKSSVINNSGRLAFEIINEDGDRVPETANTQSSAFSLFPNTEECTKRFKTAFSLFGVVKL